MTGVICGTGSYIPPCTLTNHELSQMVDTSDPWIQERTGVHRRHIVTTETTVSMACEAGKRALADAGMTAESIDLIIVATMSSDLVLPCTACEVQNKLGAVHAVCFDLNAACSGFLFAWNTALCYLQSGICHTALLIGSETLSALTDWTDRNTCILFGDGAGAVIMQAKEGVSYQFVAHSDGSHGNALICQHDLHTNITTVPADESVSRDPYMRMDGRAVFSFAVKRVPEAIHDVLDYNGLTADDIDYYILHQANRRIVASVAIRLDIPLEKFPMNLQEYGNTSSASIPILLDELHRKQVLKKGQKLILAGFGAGLSWGAAVLDWDI